MRTSDSCKNLTYLSLTKGGHIAQGTHCPHSLLTVWLHEPWHHSPSLGYRWFITSVRASFSLQCCPSGLIQLTLDIPLWPLKLCVMFSDLWTICNLAMDNQSIQWTFHTPYHERLLIVGIASLKIDSQKIYNSTFFLIRQFGNSVWHVLKMEWSLLSHCLGNN